MEKTFLFYLFSFFVTYISSAQSVDIRRNNIEIKSGTTNSLFLYRINEENTQRPVGVVLGSYENGSYFNHGGMNVKEFEFSQYINGDGTFKFSTGLGESMSISSNNIIHSVFTKFGSDAPAIKVKKLTGTTAASQGGTAQVSHGLTPSKILDIRVLVEYSTGDFVPHSYESVSQFKYEWVSEDGIIYIRNISGNSSQILSKPIKILITYEE